MTGSKWILTLACVFGLIGCYGRPNPLMRANGVFAAHKLVSQAQIDPGRPAVVTFSALWCHPCREEIDSLNQASREFGAGIQIRGFLVEGQDKGSPVQPSDLAAFTSFTGAMPVYKMMLDQNWRLFDILHTPQGHALPTIVILDSSGNISEVIQQSLDYETQLRPLLLALVQGAIAPVPTPTPPQPNPTPGQQQITDSIGNWSARAEVQAHPELLANLTASWQTGLTKYAFTAGEMPLNDGKLTFLWDGSNQNTPQSASWKSDTPVSVCTLQLVLKPDGTLQSSNGNCRPK